MQVQQGLRGIVGRSNFCRIPSQWFVLYPDRPGAVGLNHNDLYVKDYSCQMGMGLLDEVQTNKRR